MNDNFVTLEHIYKVYPNGIEAVHDFNLNIKKHEFIVIVGPSGCGKSTTLRMVAGLEDISEGRLLIDGKYSNEETPKDRDIAMVFQSYSLYPHMTVKENISFGIRMREYPFPVVDKDGNEEKTIDKQSIDKLQKQITNLEKQTSFISNNIKKLDITTSFGNEKSKTLNKRLSLIKEAIEKNKKEIDRLEKEPITKIYYRHLNKEEIDERVDKVAKILELTDYLDRKPAELSGGQRQRVALGRSIIRNAKVFLMDEPLSNLDAKLRGTMRSEIIKLHQDINATIIYVTHDQTEAMTMASRIVVMKDGFIQQIGTPEEVYQKPNNTFVANFIGSPAMNIVPAKYSEKEISLYNGLKIKNSKENHNEFIKFYENEAALYRELKNRLNTDIEEILLSSFPHIKKYILSSKKDIKKLIYSLGESMEKPLKDCLLKMDNMCDVALTNESVSNDDAKLVRSTLKKDVDNINKNYRQSILSVVSQGISSYEDNCDKNDSINADAGFKTLLENVSLFKLTFKNEFLNELIDNFKENFNKCIELSKCFVNSILHFKNSDPAYLGSVLNSYKTLLQKLNKENQHQLIEATEKVIDEVEHDVILEDVISSLNDYEKLLLRVNSLSDAEIRNLYHTVLRIKGRNSKVDWMLDVLDKSIASKKHENKLRNEYLLLILIDGLINEFCDVKNRNDILLGLRPEDVHVKDEQNIKKYGKLTHEFKVDIAELLGKEYILHLSSGVKGRSLVVQLPNEGSIKAGDTVELIVDVNKVHVFDFVSEKRIY